MMESFWNFLQLESAAGRGSELSARLGKGRLRGRVWGRPPQPPSDRVRGERQHLPSPAALFGSGGGPVPLPPAWAAETGQVQSAPLPQPPGFPLRPSPPPGVRCSARPPPLRGGGGGPPGMFEKAQASRERTSRLLYASSPGMGWALSGGSPVSAPSSPPTDSASARPAAGLHLGARRGRLGAPSRARALSTRSPDSAPRDITPGTTNLQEPCPPAARPFQGAAPRCPGRAGGEGEEGGGGGRSAPYHAQSSECQQTVPLPCPPPWQQTPSLASSAPSSPPHPNSQLPQLKPELMHLPLHLARCPQPLCNPPPPSGKFPSHMGACLPAYTSALTLEPAQLSAFRGPRALGNAQAAAETTLETLAETGPSC
ncbi:basic salivary proline-rich protein 1-like [Choloepus didactylus]|uniref:basic salivary proline-rich protein 1-like n=1 Tax=Choloepus didactylus TaxID=27675 RepID=UPI00189DA975|nr:basic salivary proline-rich protein 1-like [Choloepus didactylus]